MNKLFIITILTICISSCSGRMFNKKDLLCAHSHTCCLVGCGCCNSQRQVFHGEFIDTLKPNHTALKKRDFNEITEIPNYWQTEAEIEKFSNKVVLKFDTINQQKFEDYKSQFIIAFDSDSSLINYTDSSFTINSNTSYIEFKSSRNYESSYSYCCLINALNAHMVWERGTYNHKTYLLDKENDIKMTLPSNYDAGPRGPYISLDNEWMVVLSGPTKKSYLGYNHYDSEIKIYKVTPTQGLKGINLYGDYLTKEWSIVHFIWTKKNTFAVKVYGENYKYKLQNYKYYEITIVE
jgi:hypothetical protein